MSRLNVITMPTWSSACASAATAKTTAVFIGTSTTQGGNATTYTRRYVQILAGKLSRKYGDGNLIQHFNPMCDPGSFTYTGSYSYLSEGLNIRTVSLASGATMSSNFWCSAFTLYFVQGAAYSPFTLTVDGVDRTVTPDTSRSGDHHDGEYTISGLSYTAHAITITAPSGGAKISGVLLCNYANGDLSKGIQIFNGGHGGLNTNDFINQPGMIERIASLRPAAINMLFGTNDYGASMPVATYQANLQSIVNDIRASVTSNPDILIIHTYRRLDFTPPIPWSLYGDAERTVAASNPGCHFIDISGYYPASQAADIHNWIDTDNLHQTDAGHSEMAYLLTRCYM